MINEESILMNIFSYYNKYKKDINSQPSFSDAMQIHCEFINNIINLLESIEAQTIMDSDKYFYKYNDKYNQLEEGDK